MRVARAMGWTEAQMQSASLEYVLELAADMTLEAESVKAAGTTTSRPGPGRPMKFISKRE